jgi:hypothetical protein
MQTLNPSINAFALMCDPDAVKSALEHAAKWTLNSRTCHPLDRPTRITLPRELLRFDEEVDKTAD